MPALTTSVKDELCGVQTHSLSAMRAEACAMFRFAGGLQVANGAMMIQTELTHAKSAQRLWTLLRRIFNIDAEMYVSSTSMRNGNHYIVRVADKAEQVARSIGLIDTFGRPVRGLPGAIVGGSKNDASAAWRGAFLARGSLLEPGRNAALEVTCPGHETALALGGLARRLDIGQVRIRETRGVHRVDIREGDSIATLLVRMGAHDGMLQWESLRTERELTGNINRLANFDDANMRRSVDAAVVAVIRVRRAFEILGDDIPENLRQAGQLRIEHPEDSLNLLGERLDPPATKDAVAGRIRRLTTMADRKAEELGIPTTMDAVKAATAGDDL